MSQIPDKVVRRLEKLLALTASSNQNEAANAQSRIDALCTKYGIELDQLLSGAEEQKERYIYYYNAPYKKLAIQILYMLVPERPIYRSRVKQSNLVVDLTDSEYAEFELYHSVLKPALRQHMEDSVSAFISANDIYPDTVPEAFVDDEDEDWARLNRVAAMASGITPTPVHKAISHE